MSKNAILLGIAHAEAQARLLSVAKHLVPTEVGPCNRAEMNPDGEWVRCGGCWPCLYGQLKDAVAEVERTSVTFTEVAEAIEAGVSIRSTDGDE